MANEIKSKITLDGEKQYSQALKDAQRNLKTLRSELKAETAELGANATQSQKAEAKIKSLKAQIAEQEKIVKTYKDALAEVREKYADNEDEIARWEQRLNSARASLAGMQNEMAGLSSGIAQVGATMQSSATEAAAGVVATKSFADAIEKIGTAGGSVSSSIEGIFTGMVSHVRDAISQIWSQVTELAGRANDWADLGAIWNTDASTIQQWYHAVRSTANDFGDLNNAVTKIVMGDQEKIAEATGVSLVNYTDKWQGAMAVMDSLSEMGYEERLGALETIFGDKRAGSVTKLLDAWGDIQKNQADFDPSKGGFGMTEEQLKTMDEVAKQVASIQEKWSAFKDSFNAGLWGELTLSLGSNVEGALDALNLFFKAETQEERDKALDDFKKHLTEFFKKLGEAIKEAAKALDEIGTDLQGSEDGTLRTIGKIVSALSDLLEWLGNPDSVNQIVAGLETLAGFWLVGKGVKMASTIASIVKNIDVIRNFKAPDLSNPTAPSSPSAPSGDGGATVAAAGKGKGLLSGVGAWLSDALGMSLTGAGLGAAISAGLVYGGAKLASANNYKWDVTDDRGRYESWSGREQKIIETTVRGVLQGGSQMSQEWQLNWMASNLHGRMFDLFDYTNTNGEAGNMLMNWLGMNNGTSAAAFNLLARSEGWTKDRNTGMYQVPAEYLNSADPALRSLLVNAQNAGGQADYANLWGEMMPFLAGSGHYNAEGLWTISERIEDLLAQKGAGQPDTEAMPSSWWRNQETNQQQTNQTLGGMNGILAGLPSQIGAEVGKNMNGLAVQMDGQTVGYIVAPYVDQYLGANAPVTFGP